MTDLIYQTDSYIRQFEASVVAVDIDAHGVVLDRTAFYPGGGGQPADCGTLLVNGAAIPVRQVKKIGGQIVHLLEGDTLPDEGESVSGQLDWDRRYRLMRTHTPIGPSSPASRRTSSGWRRNCGASRQIPKGSPHPMRVELVSSSKKCKGGTRR